MELIPPSARRLAVVLAIALAAVSCGSTDDAEEAGPATDAAETEALETTVDTDVAAEGDDEPAADSAESDVSESDAPPLRGGSLTFLLEAETDTWDIPSSACATSCINVMRTVADSLTIVNEAGEVEPFLLESYETNDDFTVHTLTMREGVTFHDGTPADGAAVHRSLSEMAGGLVQGQVLRDLADGADSIVLVDDMTVEVTFARPFATFGEVLSSRTGWLIAPAYWDDPDRANAVVVGTGPFVMTDWSRGEQTVVTANPDYWRTDAAGGALPYLDEIVFRPIPDVATRRATMEADDADMSMDSFGENKEFWTSEWPGGLVDPGANRDIWYLLLNNARPPFDTADMRRALALCTDREEHLAFRAPLNAIVDGPFAEGALGYLEDPGFPQFDPDAGNALLDEIGRPEVVTYGTTNVPSQLLTAELFADMWATNCGLEVDIDQFDQSELITRALTGQFDLLLWRNLGQGNPALETFVWHSRHAEGLATNFGKIIDDQLDQLLFDAMATTDPAELDGIGQDINRLFADNVYNLWLNTNEWFLPHQPEVHGAGHLTLPSGNLALPSLIGRTWVSEAWLTE
ncbi:MAG: ABC transporter substrate-binding protein [Acidimicrobiia bacterium]|nr:ABC transporter substrate-binding protein [Acidimicrobiia bacterium]